MCWAISISGMLYNIYRSMTWCPETDIRFLLIIFYYYYYYLMLVELIIDTWIGSGAD